TVATNASMANPYVPPVPRETARALMLGALERSDVRMHGTLDEYKVSHVLVRVSDIGRMSELRRWFPSELHRNDRYVLFARNDPRRENAADDHIAGQVIRPGRE